MSSGRPAGPSAVGPRPSASRLARLAGGFVDALPPWVATLALAHRAGVALSLSALEHGEILLLEGETSEDPMIARLLDTSAGAVWLAVALGWIACNAVLASAYQRTVGAALTGLAVTGRGLRREAVRAVIFGLPMLLFLAAARMRDLGWTAWASAQLALVCLLLAGAFIDTLWLLVDPGARTTLDALSTSRLQRRAT